MISNEKRFCLMHSMRKILLQSLPIERADTPFENMVGGSDALRREEGADIPSIYQQSSPRSQVVWVIDDSPTTRKILETCLGREGYQTAIFADGVTALRWLHTPGVRLPDLLLLDIEMPKMDGYAVAQYLKARPQYRHLPIVMLTGRHGVLDRLKARLAGAQYYLTKPFRTQSILATVQAYLGPALNLDEASTKKGIPSMSENHSEVAHLLRQIRLEYEAAQQGLSGLSQGSAEHQVMTARMNRVGGYREQLATLVGEAKATSTIGALYTTIMEEEETPPLKEPCP